MKNHSKTPALLAAATALVLGATTLGATASAAPPPPSRGTTLVDGVGGPFQIAFRRGTLHYTDGFAGTVNKLTGSGPTVVTGVQGDLAGVEFSPDGKTMAFASTTADGASLTIRRAGRPDIVADLGEYELTKNPDRKRTYGILSGGNKCAADFLSKVTELPATYQGQVDSHPYQVARLPHGAWAVADAGGNDIVRVSRTGDISTLAVLPRQPITFTPTQVAALGGPKCVVGVTYAFEPVPTDVERGRSGALWVSTLPGGPEDPSLGARGAVYRVGPHGGIGRVKGGFAGATNLALSGRGIYVTELFKGQVSLIQHNGRVHRSIGIDSPLSVETRGHYVYVGTLSGDAGPGKIARFRR